jgi:hypothetical protein
MARVQLTLDEQITALETSKLLMTTAKTKEETIAILASAGSAVGYKPAFRALVMGKSASESIRHL